MKGFIGFSPRFDNFFATIFYALIPTVRYFNGFIVLIVVSVKSAIGRIAYVHFTFHFFFHFIVNSPFINIGIIGVGAPSVIHYNDLINSHHSSAFVVNPSTTFGIHLCFFQLLSDFPLTACFSIFHLANDFLFLIG